nr:6271_t:CDS:2 [Entrophospora candida]
MNSKTGDVDLRYSNPVMVLTFLFVIKSQSCTREIPDLKSAIKAIKAIVGNYCGYTIKNKGAPMLPLYKPKTADEIQELFDVIDDPVIEEKHSSSDSHTLIEIIQENSNYVSRRHNV